MRWPWPLEVLADGSYRCGFRRPTSAAVPSPARRALQTVALWPRARLTYQRRLRRAGMTGGTSVRTRRLQGRATRLKDARTRLTIGETAGDAGARRRERATSYEQLSSAAAQSVRGADADSVPRRPGAVPARTSRPSARRRNA